MDQCVSVIVACYNQEDYIQECLESIFQQTYQNLELIIINDGSTDQSLVKIQSLVAEYHLEKVEIINQENQGIVFVRNLGLQKAQGDFMIFVDGDDTLPSDYIAQVLTIAQEEEADVVYTSLTNLETGELVLPVKDFDAGELIKGNFIHASSLIRRSALGQSRFDEALNRERLEDYDFFLSLYRQGTVHFVPCRTTTLNYRISPNSRSHHSHLGDYYRAYSYLLAKSAGNDSLVVQEALDYHFNRLLALDIESSIQNERIRLITLVEDDEIELLSRPIELGDSLVLDVTTIETLRVRPSNIPSFYDSLTVQVPESGEKLLPVASNGIIRGEEMLFYTLYPYVDYDVRDLEQIELSYHRYNITDITSETYIGTRLGKELLAQDQELRQRDILNQQAKTVIDEQTNLLQVREAEIVNLKQALETSTHQYETLFQEHHAVIGSRRWRIPTKLINFFRRKS